MTGCSSRLLAAAWHADVDLAVIMSVSACNSQPGISHTSNNWPFYSTVLAALIDTSAMCCFAPPGKRHTRVPLPKCH